MGKAVIRAMSRGSALPRQGAFDPIQSMAARGGCGAAGITSRALTGGYQNQVFHLSGPFGDWVVKRFRESTDLTLSPNLARAEARALDILGPLGIAPRLIDFIDTPEAGKILTYTYHPGRPWPGAMDTGAEAGGSTEISAASLSGVAILLRRLHQLTVDGFRDVPVMPADILMQGDQFLACGDRSVDLARLRPAIVDCPPLLRRSLLHTDVGPGNLIVGSQDLRLIDWQCPALGDAVEDLCAFLSPAFQILYDRTPLTTAQRSAFLGAYGDRRVSERLALLEPYFHWRMAAYCSMRLKQYGTTRPAAAASYKRALDALLHLLAR